MHAPRLTLFAGATLAVLTGCGSQSGASEPKGAIIAPHAGDAVQIGTGPHPVLIKVDRSTTGSQRLFVFQVVLDPGDSLPVHRHHHDDELIFVHTGEVAAIVGEEGQVSPAGTTLFIPAGKRVGLRNLSTGSATLLIIFAVPHMAEYIRSLGNAPGAPRKTLSADELDALRRRHDITFP